MESFHPIRIRFAITFVVLRGLQSFFVIQIAAATQSATPVQVRSPWPAVAERAVVSPGHTRHTKDWLGGSYEILSLLYTDLLDSYF